MNDKIITRIAPSPTGFLHIGTARTALFNFLFSRKNKGTFLLRIEDTDKERSTKGFEEDILKYMAWLGINWDNKVVIHQSENEAIYEKYLKDMIEKGFAYVSKDEETKPIPIEGHGLATTAERRTEVIRFKNPNTKIKFQDIIRGDVEFDTTELGDFVIAKSMQEPLYHLAVVVDDFLAGVTHIIRGEDGISNTPRQILIQEAIGAPSPLYAHLPLILAQDRSKLSKRHGAVSIAEYEKMGYLPSAIINYLALLGWNPGGEQEIFSLEELVAQFDLTRVQKGGAIFNIEKLDWINKEHMKKLSSDIIMHNIEERISNFQPARMTEASRSGGFPISNKRLINKIVPIIFDRISKWGDIDFLIDNGEVKYFFEKPEYENDKLVWKSLKDNVDKWNIIKNHLEQVRNILSEISDADFESADKIKEIVWPYADKNGRGEVLWPMRVSLSGLDKSPDPFILVSIFGKKETIERIENAILKLK